VHRGITGVDVGLELIALLLSCMVQLDTRTLAGSKLHVHESRRRLYSCHHVAGDYGLVSECSRVSQNEARYHGDALRQVTVETSCNANGVNQ